MSKYTRPVVAADDEGNMYNQWDSEEDLIADVNAMSPEELELHFQEIMGGVVRHYGDDQGREVQR